ncbi:MAG: hypothetical protein LCI00_25360 [Chloroflexi bacterium]|nr:hypothetical protein [Chloroflexota bacterium]MCC6894924.1 hypothetical protein [Anaerolineae bacterium]
MITTTPKQWHVGNWSALGWLETVIKAAAFVAGISALLSALSGGTFTTPTGGRLVQVLVLGFAALALTGAIVERYMQREIIAMVFVLVNNVAHWGMVYALLVEPGPGGKLLVFASLMLCGDVVKLVWLRVSGYTQDGRPQRIFYVLTSGFIIAYVVILLLAVAG